MLRFRSTIAVIVLSIYSNNLRRGWCTVPAVVVAAAMQLVLSVAGTLIANVRNVASTYHSIRSQVSVVRTRPSNKYHNDSSLFSFGHRIRSFNFLFFIYSNLKICRLFENIFAYMQMIWDKFHNII